MDQSALLLESTGVCRTCFNVVTGGKIGDNSRSGFFCSCVTGKACNDATSILKVIIKSKTHFKLVFKPVHHKTCAPHQRLAPLLRQLTGPKKRQSLPGVSAGKDCSYVTTGLTVTIKWFNESEYIKLEYIKL